MDMSGAESRFLYHTVKQANDFTVSKALVLFI